MGNVFKKFYLVAKMFLKASKYFKFNETSFEFVFCVYVFMAAGFGATSVMATMKQVKNLLKKELSPLHSKLRNMLTTFKRLSTRKPCKPCTRCYRLDHRIGLYSVSKYTWVYYFQI